ncbi:unnamed protein product [Prunus brigantina]
MSLHPPNDSESAFGHLPSAISDAFGTLPSFGALRPSVPSIIRRMRYLHIPLMIRNRPSAFGHSAFSLRPSVPSIIRRMRYLHIPPMIRNRPSAFGHSAFGHQPLAIQPLAIGTFHHLARAMSSHPPNDSESAFSLQLRPSAFCRVLPFSLRPSAFGHQPPAISLRPSAPFHHLACDIFTSPQ